jgi:16S rRNA processing protein RimM
LTGEIYSSHPGRDDELMQSRRVALSKPGQRRELDLERIWRHDGRPVFKFAGVDSISAAEEWEGADVLVPVDQGVRREAGEYTYSDLIGCRVEAVSANGRLEIGTVRGIEEFGGAPLLKVEAEDGREILVPFARAICKEIDVVRKVIRAEVPEGLLEL